MKPPLASWIMEQAPGIGPWMIGLIVAGLGLRFLAGWPLWKYGPRYWRVERRMRDRAWKKEIKE